MSKLDLDAIEGRAMAATACLELGETDPHGNAHVWGLETGGFGTGDMSAADAVLIVHARADHLALVARVRELEAALSAAIDALEPHQFVSGEEDEFNDDEVIAAVREARAVLEGTP